MIKNTATRESPGAEKQAEKTFLTLARFASCQSRETAAPRKA